jgi:hypothetical protein
MANWTGERSRVDAGRAIYLRIGRQRPRATHRGP